MTKKNFILLAFILLKFNQYAREDTISIYVLKRAKVDVNKIIKEEAEEKKK